MGFFDTYLGRDINEELEDIYDIPGAVIVDVREPYEYRAGHVAAAININAAKITIKNRSYVESILTNKTAPIFTYCKSGSRSGRAAGILRQMGYTNVTNIGGIANYEGELEI